eukprot:3545766-Rhodomonas_salina.1
MPLSVGRCHWRLTDHFTTLSLDRQLCQLEANVVCWRLTTAEFASGADRAGGAGRGPEAGAAALPDGHRLLLGQGPDRHLREAQAVQRERLRTARVTKLFLPENASQSESTVVVFGNVSQIDRILEKKRVEDAALKKKPNQKRKAEVLDVAGTSDAPYMVTRWLCVGYPGKPSEKHGCWW